MKNRIYAAPAVKGLNEYDEFSLKFEWLKMYIQFYSWCQAYGCWSPVFDILMYTVLLTMAYLYYITVYICVYKA